MFLSHKNNVLLHFHEDEWKVRYRSKGMTKAEYWAWIESITSGKPPVTNYPSEDFTIIEINDEDIRARLNELSDYNSEQGHNIKVYTSKRNAEEILDIDGKSYDPKQYANSHLVGDDTAKDARILADKWANIRNFRNQDLASSDWTILDDSPLENAKKIEWQNYRQKLRDVPKDNDDPDNIDWPVKP